MKGGMDLGGSRQFTHVIEVYGRDGGGVGTARGVFSRSASLGGPWTGQ
jgi:hypothetical protein